MQRIRDVYMTRCDNIDFAIAGKPRDASVYDTALLGGLIELGSIHAESCLFPLIVVVDMIAMIECNKNN